MKSFLGTGRLTRLALRRDRIVLPVTITLSVLMVGGSAPALISAYPGYSEQLAYVMTSVPSVIGRFFQGTIQGVSIGSILLAETFLFTAVILAIMSIFIVSRHTRYNEETGAGELIGSTITGRSAPLTAALLAAVGANVLTGLMIFAMIATMPEFDTVGAAFMSMGLAATGIFFAGLTAVTVQLSDYRRGANFMAIGFLILSYMVAGFGNALGKIGADGLSVSASWVTWLSPLGWASLIHPYYDNAVLPLLLLIIGATALSALGFFLLTKRDVGSSIFESRPGRSRAKPSLLSATGLARKLQKGSFIGWSFGFLITGVMVGAMVNNFRDLFQSNEFYKEYMGTLSATGNYSEVIIGAMVPMMAAMLAGYVVTALLKMQNEEGQDRLEFLISTTLGKIKWLFSHVKLIILGIILSLTIMGVATGLAYVATTDTKEVTFWGLTLSGLANIPAMLLFMSVILLVFAISGRFVKSFAWGYYGYCVLIANFANIFSWPDWTVKLSPFSHTPAVPNSMGVDWQPLIVMTTISVVIMTVSALVFRRRDLNLK